MPSYGTNIAIFEDDRILLTLREDFEVWCLPGGHMDSGETFAQCAIREAREETGLEVELTHFVGSYNRLNWRAGLYHVQLFRADIVGGTLSAQPGEVLEIRYFPISELPDNMLIGQRHRVIDAAQRLTGIVKTEQVTWAFPHSSRAELYEMRDKSGLSRVEFYNKYCPQLLPEQIITEVAGYKQVNKS